MVGVGRMGSKDGGGAKWTENGGIGGHSACVARGTPASADSEPSASVGNGQLARVGDEPSATVSGDPARENRGGEVSEVASEGEHPSVRVEQPARVEQSQSSSRATRGRAREERGAVATVVSRAGEEAARGSGESVRGRAREARGAVARGTVASGAGEEAARGSGESARGGFEVALAARVGEREDLRTEVERGGAMKREKSRSDQSDSESRSDLGQRESRNIGGRIMDRGSAKALEGTEGRELHHRVINVFSMPKGRKSSMQLKKNDNIHILTIGAILGPYRLILTFT
ncbi:hypothetical protein O6H91_07G080700 [Diphasiastrum complanatum]|uniref:Uncharacterized protein n=1 Tax=Diphasiastrum complanatum TaxID=34168 RepID=A0ACC2D6V7_DIPCM|nr:hypothetical protein O6H91_07G080700 [Diphasiastrum complanatum]